ncbi:glycerate kinase [Aeromonas hydrophila]|uniref:glycerate kinase n=1 Tax=Aeromonas hydrophila TaxID=644 RepID=UPI0013E0D885|nr:glycerate kinase [Aeromonas hydrophila]
MPFRLCIIEINPSSSDADGNVRAKLDNGLEIWFYYQGSNQQGYQWFPVNGVVEVMLVGRLSSVSAIEQPSISLSFPNRNCCYQATGQITGTEEIDGESLLKLSSILSFPIDNELGKELFAIGSWVSIHGELWAEI